MTTPTPTAGINPLAPDHIPSYVVGADGSDHLLTSMIVFTLLLILGIGLLYLTLHALPEKMGHHANHTQMQVIGILALLALFTHNNAFWVIALLVAAFRPPDFLTPLTSIAGSLSRIASAQGAGGLTPVSDPVPEDDGESAQPQTAPHEKEG